MALLNKLGYGGLTFGIDRLVVGQNQEVGLFQISGDGIGIFGVRYTVITSGLDGLLVFLAIPTAEIVGAAATHHQNLDGLVLSKCLACSDQHQRQSRE